MVNNDLVIFEFHYILIGDKLKAHYENAMVMYQPEDEGYECRNEYVIFLPIDPTITKIEHLKVIIVIN